MTDDLFTIIEPVVRTFHSVKPFLPNREAPKKPSARLGNLVWQSLGGEKEEVAEKHGGTVSRIFQASGVVLPNCGNRV